MALGITAAVILLALDHALDTGHWSLPQVLRIQPASAQELLAVIAGAMITTAGVVFSLTVVSLQLASQQFSPRVMRTFVRDRHAQLVIGLLVATFAYCVLVLWALRGDDSTAPVLATAAAVPLAWSPSWPSWPTWTTWRAACRWARCCARCRSRPPRCSTSSPARPAASAAALRSTRARWARPIGCSRRATGG